MLDVWAPLWATPRRVIIETPQEGETGIRREGGKGRGEKGIMKEENRIWR